MVAGHPPSLRIERVGALVHSTCTLRPCIWSTLAVLKRRRARPAFPLRSCVPVGRWPTDWRMLCPHPSLSTIARPRLPNQSVSVCSWPRSPACLAVGRSAPPEPIAGHPPVPSCSSQLAHQPHAHCPLSGACAARSAAAIRLPTKSPCARSASKPHLTGRPIARAVAVRQSGWRCCARPMDLTQPSGVRCQ